MIQVPDSSLPDAARAETEQPDLDAGPDASQDAATDTGVDSGPVYDDAGCTVTGALPPADGLPTNGLVLWLRADRGLSMTTAGAICHWDDLSGNGNDFTVSGSTAPALVSNALRNHPGVSFTGDALAARAGVLGIGATSARTVAVFGANGSTAVRAEYFYQGKGATAGTYFGLDQNTFNATVSEREGVYVTNNAYESGLATTTAARSHILSISDFTAGTALPGALVYSVDGTDLTLTRTPGGLGNGTVESFAPADFTNIGIGPAGSTRYVGEVIVWNRALTPTERTQVNDHFQAHFLP